MRAVDGQPVAAGMRLMERSHAEAGTYTVAPARCGDKDRKQDDESRQEDARQEGSQGAAERGTAVAGAAALEQAGDQVEPHRPLSR